MSAVHFVLRGGNPFGACWDSAVLSATVDPGRVTCFRCRKTEAFKDAQMGLAGTDGRPSVRQIPLSLTEYNAAGPRRTPPRMTDGNDLTDGVFIFHDTFIESASMEVVPQLSGNVEITISYGPDDGYMLTLSHLDRADLLRALLHDFHYSPERGGPQHDHE